MSRRYDTAYWQINEAITTLRYRWPNDDRLIVAAMRTARQWLTEGHKDAHTTARVVKGLAFRDPMPATVPPVPLAHIPDYVRPVKAMRAG